jgi:glutathione S-transferase
VAARFLAREFGLVGNNNYEISKADAIATSVMLLIDKYFTDVYNVVDEDEKKVSFKRFIDEDVPSQAAMIEKLIDWYSEDDQNLFCVGKKLTYADLFVYELATNYFPSDKFFTQKYPNIYRVKENVENMSSISNYLNSKEYTKNKHSQMLWEC